MASVTESAGKTEFPALEQNRALAIREKLYRQRWPGFRAIRILTTPDAVQHGGRAMILT
jgi:hypothetical protein